MSPIRAVALAFYGEIPRGLVVLVILFLVYLRIFADARTFIFIMFGAVSSTIVGFYILFGRALLGIRLNDSDLRTSLEAAITELKGIIRYYYLFGVFGFPILFLAATIMAKLIFQTLLVLDGPFYTAIGVCVISTPLLHFVMKQKLQAKYGRHLADLEECLHNSLAIV